MLLDTVLDDSVPVRLRRFSIGSFHEKLVKLSMVNVLDCKSRKELIL